MKVYVKSLQKPTVTSFLSIRSNNDYRADYRAHHKCGIWTYFPEITVRLKYLETITNQAVKSAMRVHFGSCSCRDYSITIQPIRKRFTAVERVIRAIHFLLCNLLDMLVPLPSKWASKSGSAVVCALHKFSYYCHVQVVHTSAPIRIWACINVYGTSDSMHYIRRSF